MKFKYKGDREVELLGIQFKPGQTIEIENPKVIKDMEQIPQFEKVKKSAPKKEDK